MQHRGALVVARRLNCSAACEILPDQGSKPCPLHRQADSYPLRPQGRPIGGSYSRKQGNHGQVRTVHGEDSINALGGSLSRSDESDLGIKGDGIETL